MLNAKLSPSVAIVQSSYVPWKGYFDIVHDVDVFVFFDDVQFTTRDWRTRNRIKTDKGLEWLSVPAGNDRNRLICDVTLQDSSWQSKHWRTISQHYAKCPHFADYRAYFEEMYLGRTWTSLSELNQQLTRDIAVRFLGVTTRFVDARSLEATGQKANRLLDLLGKLEARTYVSGPSARDYIDPWQFAERGLELVWKDYGGYPEYPQRFPPFEHAVTILDLLFNVGPHAPWYIWGWRDGPLPGASSPGTA